MLVPVDVRKAHLGSIRHTCGEECEAQLHSRKYSRLVVLVVMVVSIKILYQFAWLLLVRKKNLDRTQQRSHQEVPAQIVYLTFKFEELTKLFPFLVAPAEELLT